MQTLFSERQLEDREMAVSEKILRSCVHCGFCTATCPTYLLEGDELDSPRGRIYLIKEMFERGKPASSEIVRHIDRCLSCLACMTTCPSGVHYMHLVDHARAHIEATYRRSLGDRAIRTLLAGILPHPRRFAAALRLASVARPLTGLLLPSSVREGAKDPSFFDRLAAMATLAPRVAPRKASLARLFPAQGRCRGRVALLGGCTQSVLNPSINEAAIRLLNRNGIEVVLAEGEGCCGALVHHMGRKDEALALARANVDAWTKAAAQGLDAILITASGCGTTIKDYGFMLRDDAAYAAKAAEVSRRAKDISEYLAELDLAAPEQPSGLIVAYQSACSLQHGQQIADQPKRLLRNAGFRVRDVPEGHICCGSAGTYNIMQPFFARKLAARKLANIGKLNPDVIATGNVGCMMQLASGTNIPIVHLVELIDWANGGPPPLQIETQRAR